MSLCCSMRVIFFFNDTATTEIYTLSLHDALPIGARIVIAPSAKIAHRETIASGERPITAHGTRRLSRQDLQRRHQLLVVATGWGRRNTLITLSQLMVM